MKTLIVPDVHEQAEKLEQVVKPLFQDFDQVVFLGDWFDTFGKHAQHQMIDFIKEHSTDPKYVFLMGNHDAHYRWTNHQFQCSGWNAGTARIILDRMSPEDWAPFRISYQVGPFLLSHAGYHERTIKYREQEAHAVTIADQGGFHPLFAIGQSRGGWAAYGGPLWLDFNYEFEDIPDLPQIVGHTVQRRTPIVNGASTCLDTGLRHLGQITDDGTFRYAAI
jgi:hypothetical protein